MLINSLSKLFEGPLRREALGKSVKIRFWGPCSSRVHPWSACLCLGLEFRRTVNQYFGYVNLLVMGCQRTQVLALRSAPEASKRPSMRPGRILTNR